LQNSRLGPQISPRRNLVDDTFLCVWSGKLTVFIDFDMVDTTEVLWKPEPWTQKKCLLFGDYSATQPQVIAAEAELVAKGYAVNELAPMEKGCMLKHCSCSRFQLLC
jgi:hypothetical protein